MKPKIARWHRRLCLCAFIIGALCLFGECVNAAGQIIIVTNAPPPASSGYSQLLAVYQAMSPDLPTPTWQLPVTVTSNSVTFVLKDGSAGAATWGAIWRTTNPAMTNTVPPAAGWTLLASNTVSATQTTVTGIVGGLSPGQTIVVIGRVGN